MNNNIDLEKTILGSLMLDASIIIESLNILREYDFTDESNIKIFNAIKKIKKERKEVDIFLVQQVSGVLNEILIDIQNMVVSTANINESIRQLRNITLKRKFILGSTELLEKMEHSLSPANDIVLFSSKLRKLSEYSADSMDTTRRTALDDIREIKAREPEKKYSFGIKFLDDALNGYHSKDVVIIGSKSGRGKSEACNIIADKAARDKNKILYLALEAEEGEIGARIKFRALCRKYFDANPKLIHPLSFDKWMSKELIMLDEYNECVDRELESYVSNIFVQYRNTEFTVEDLEQQLNSCKDINVIILDHIHYVDILDNNENKGLKKIIKCIRSNNLLYNKPIIVVAHLRKTNKKEDGLTPDEEDLHGSSDLLKIATKSILFSPDYTEIHDNLFRTFFRVTKCRRNPSALRYTAKLYFDARYNLYQDKYKLGQYKPFAKEFIECTKLPSWYPEYYSYN